jgi:hypothetical protein
MNITKIMCFSNVLPSGVLAMSVVRKNARRHIGHSREKMRHYGGLAATLIVNILFGS